MTDEYLDGLDHSMTDDTDAQSDAEQFDEYDYLAAAPFEITDDPVLDEEFDALDAQTGAFSSGSMVPLDDAVSSPPTVTGPAILAAAASSGAEVYWNGTPIGSLPNSGLGAAVEALSPVARLRLSETAGTTAADAENAYPGTYATTKYDGTYVGAGLADHGDG